MATPAERIATYIKDNGIKQTHVAEKINMDRNVLSTRLKGKTKFSPEEIERICWALGKTPNDFLKAKEA